MHASLGLGDLLAVACAMAWATAVLLFRKLGAVPAVALNLFKNAFAATLLLLTMLAFGIPFSAARSATAWGMLCLSGVVGMAVADTLFFAGLRRIDASMAAAADCAYAPSVMILSVLFLGEPLRARLLLGAPLVLIGLYIATAAPRTRAARTACSTASGPDLADKPAVVFARADRVGISLAIAGVVLTAVAVVIAKPILDTSNLVEVTTVRMLAGTLALFVVQAMTGNLRTAFTLFRPQPLWRFAFPAALSGTYIAMLLWLGGMKYGTPSRIALLNQLGAVFVLIFSRILGEPVAKRRWLGVTLAIVGALIVLSA
jgi:drug/metabolite transporter (DMT)-like permease